MSAIALTLALITAPVVQDKPQLKPLPDKNEEVAKFMTPIPKSAPASLRMAAYRERQKMEAESFYGNLKWRCIGPEYQGGRVIDIEVPRSKPTTTFCAFATGGLWRSDDSRITWRPIFDNESAFAIGDIAIDATGERIWIGTGENNNQRTSYAGTGVFLSEDGGKTWQHKGLEETHRIARVIVHPKDPKTVYVAAIGALYSANPNRGVFKTTDAGRTWSHVLKLDDTTGVIDLILDPRNPDTLVASALDRDRRAWNFREAGKGSALYRTTNGGKSWDKVTAGVPSGQVMGRTGLAYAPSSPNVVYAFVDNQGPDPNTLYWDERQPSGVLTARRLKFVTDEQLAGIDPKVWDRFVTSYLPTGSKADDLLQQIKDKKLKVSDIEALVEKRNPRALQYEMMEAEVFRSEDFGKTWKKTSLKMGEHGYYYCGQIRVNPKDPNDIVTLGTIVMRSKDAGRTWKETASPNHVDHHAWWFDPENPDHMLNGNDGGLYVSHDGGENWEHINKMPVGQFTTIAVDNKRPYNVMGGLQDNGTQFGPSNYRLGSQGQQFSSGWRSVGGGDGSAVAFDPREDRDVIYIASQFGAHSARDLKSNQMWNTRANLQGENLRYNWVSPLLVSPHHPDIVYVGANRVFRSLNMGRKYEPISPDVTKNKVNGDVPFSTVKEMAESPLKFGTLIVGCDDGSVKITRDHGSTWIDAPTPQPDKWVSRVIASRWDAATFYVSQSGYREDDFNAYLWKSTDYGKTWTSIVGDLPGETVNVIREDPVDSKKLYIGTDLGVWMTEDGGAHWTPLHGGIPRTPVHDLVIQEREDELVIASHARSVWIFSLKPIRDLSSEIRDKQLHIYPVSNLTYSPRWGMPARQDWQSDPITGPRIAIRFWTRTAGKATISIKSKDGATTFKSKEINAVRGFNNVDLDPMLQPGNQVIEPKIRQPKSLEEALKDPYEDQRPKFIAPGEYVIEISVGGRTERIDWKISPE